MYGRAIKPHQIHTCAPDTVTSEAPVMKRAFLKFLSRHTTNGFSSGDALRSQVCVSVPLTRISLKCQLLLLDAALKPNCRRQKRLHMKA